MSVPLVVIGGSAGGLDACSRLVAALPRGLPAALAVVLHQAPGADDYITRRLQALTALPVSTAADGQALEPSRIYVAPSDRHLRFEGDRVRVAFGPRVNRVRPAIDVAMRSAAAERGARTVGIVLSGLLDDGAAGLDAIHRAGGTVLVQSPSDAEHPDMPRNALANVEADGVATADSLGRDLVHVVHALPDDGGTVPADILTESRIDGLATGDIDMTEDIGTQVPISCPDCAGPVWEIDESGPRRYRCHVGHAFSERSMLASQAETIEESLWVALRTLEERVRMLERMARGSRTSLAASYQSQADETRTHALRIRDLLAERHPGGAVLALAEG